MGINPEFNDILAKAIFKLKYLDSAEEYPDKEETTIELNSPITDEQWDLITDVDFEHTDGIIFHTKNGKDVKFVKAPPHVRGEWIEDRTDYVCSVCGGRVKDEIYFMLDPYGLPNACPYCFADMRGLTNDE